MSRGAAETVQIRANTRRILNLSDRHQASVIVDQAFELIEIDSSVALFAHPQFDIERVANTLPRINVGRKLTPKRDDVVACLPFQTVGDAREGVRRVTQKGDLLRPRPEHSRQQRARLFLYAHPAWIIERTVFVNVSKLAFNGLEGRRRQRRDRGVIEVDRALRDGKERA